MPFHKKLDEFQNRFARLAAAYDGTLRNHVELETVIDEYSALVTSPDGLEAWIVLDRQSPDSTSGLPEELRSSSARCVAIMEKYRALKLLEGDKETGDYFANIESCIVQEFGSFRPDAAARVLLIGSGSFPMTPLYTARQTGATVVGIDIDEEAISLGRRVVERLGAGLSIRLERTPAERLEEIGTFTHVVFSSTVPDKYELLDRLHPLLHPDIVVAMRYGNHLKSLFNYPMQEVDPAKWTLADSVLRPDQVFDIALYRKS